MMTDKFGNEFQVTQNLFDTLELSRAGFMEELLSKTGQGSFQEAIEYLTGLFVRYQNEQMMACVNAVGNLESRFMGLTQHLGVEGFEFTSFDARLAPADPDNEGFDQAP